MEQEQPKDYETFEEFLESGWNDLSPFGKLTYLLQDHIWKVIFIGIVGGYWAGTYFGEFWLNLSVL
jgi:hypothetical protein